MSAVIFVTILNSAFWLFLARGITAKRKDALHIANIFIFLFIITYPCKLLLTEFGYSVINSSLFGASWQLFALFIANISALLFVTGALLFSKIPRRKTASSQVQRQAKEMGIKWRWFAAFLVFLVLAFGTEPFTRIFSFMKLRDLMQMRAEFRTGRALAALCSQAYLVCLILYMKSVLQAKHTGISKAGLLLLWCFISYVLISVSGSKYTALLPIATFVLLLNMQRVRQGKTWSFSRVMALGLAGLCLVGFFAYLRGFGSLESYSFAASVRSAFQQFTNAFDGQDNLTAILYRVENPWFGDLNYSPTIQNVFIAPIPRFLWPEKPLVLSNLYIMQHYLFERYTDHLGEVISPSMAGEMIVSGGYFYMSICSFFLGSVFGHLYRSAMYVRRSPLSEVLYIVIALNIFNLLRSGDGIVAPIVYFTGVAIAILTIASMFKKSTKKRRATRAAPQPTAANLQGAKYQYHRQTRRTQNPAKLA